jgi:hypothetical protein
VPKTRRKKINRSPTKLYRNSHVVVAEPGFGVKVAGYRASKEGEDVRQVPAKGEKAKAIHIGRQYTGRPRGKAYPYAGKKRGGSPDLTMAPRRVVGVVDAD